MLAEIFSVVAPILFGVLLGFFWARLRLPYDSNFVSALVFNLGTPLLVFYTLTNIKVDPTAFGIMAFATAAAMAAFALISYVVLRLARLERRTYWSVVMMPNTGNVGLPLCLLAFGDEGLAFAIIVYSIVSMCQFTVGVGLNAGTFSLREFARVPLIYAVAAALVFLLTGTKPPLWIANSTKLIGQMAIPLMIVTLGVSLAKLKVTSLPRSFMLSLVRFAMGLGVGVGLAEVLGLEGTPRGVLILQCAMPAAVFNYMLAARYGNNPDEVAGVIVTSTLFSFLTLPFLLSFLL